MKKIMIVAAVAAVAFGAQAKLSLTNCHTKVTNPSACAQQVFKLTASGKTVKTVGDDEYKTVSSMKISKGYLVMFSSDAACQCYDTVSVYAQLKVGKNTYRVLLPAFDIAKWSVFGKNFDTAYDAYEAGGVGKAKSWKLESDLGFFYDADSALLQDASGDDITDEFTGIQMFATAFGKAKIGVTKGSTSKGTTCNPLTPSCGESYITPGNYSGWFAGFYDGTNIGACFTCTCPDVELFGGTWKACFQSKMTTWEKAADAAFGSAVRAAMEEEGIE